jgi:hypothetical protein
MSKSQQTENSLGTVGGFAANDDETRQRFEQALTELDEKLKPWTDAIHESEQLSEEDFAVRINTRD